MQRWLRDASRQRRACSSAGLGCLPVQGRSCRPPCRRPWGARSARSVCERGGGGGRQACGKRQLARSPPSTGLWNPKPSLKRFTPLRNSQPPTLNTCSKPLSLSSNLAFKPWPTPAAAHAHLEHLLKAQHLGYGQVDPLPEAQPALVRPCDGTASGKGWGSGWPAALAPERAAGGGGSSSSSSSSEAAGAHIPSPTASAGHAKSLEGRWGLHLSRRRTAPGSRG